MLRGRSLSWLLLLGSLFAAGPAVAQSFQDDFLADTTASYTLTLIEPTEGTATFVYDAVGARAQIVAGNDFGLRVAHALPARSSGRLSLDLLPTKKFPNGGQTWIRLRQDATHYYEIYNSDGYGAGTLRKVVNGATVASASFSAGYAQNTAYHVSFDFAPGESTLSAFGQNLALAGNATPLTITSLEIETYQQTTWLDNIHYGDIVNLAPTANAGPDQTVTEGDTVQLSGTASFDTDGMITSYSWQQLSGPAVSLSGAGTSTPSFVAPDPGSASVALVFELTVTDDGGLPGSALVQIETWDAESLRFSDDFATNTTGAYALTLVEPAEGTASFVYDAPTQRAQIRTGNDFGLIVARDVPPRSSGRLSLDLLPTQKWTKGGRIFVRLIQDAANYYEISNFDGGGPGALRKVVNNATVATASFSAGYVQNVLYHLSLDFAPDQSELRAFGETLELSGNAAPLTIRRLEIETYQQTTWLDNLSYGPVVNTPPVADAGSDSAVGGGELAHLDGGASSDPDGQVVAYAWQQLSGPPVALSGANTSHASFTAPALASGTQALSFRLTVTDDGGAPGTDTVSVTVWAQSELSFTDGFTTDTTGGYTLTPINPAEGTPALLYDAAGERAQIRTGNDFGLRIARPLPPRSSGRFQVALLPTKKYPNGGKIFVRLIQDAQNYYEIFNGDGYSPGTLAKVVAGQVVEIQPLSSSYVQNQSYPLVFDFSPTLTTFEGFGHFLALEANGAPITVTRLEIETYQQDLYFDDLAYSPFVERDPFVRLTAPGDGAFQTSPTVQATAIGFRFQPGWRVAFALDAATPDEVLIIDGSAPYTAAFAGVEQGPHTLDAYVVNAGGSQVFGAGLSDHIEIEIGDYYVAVGDSITEGQGDNLPADDTSQDGRTSGGGYPPVLNDELGAATGFVNVIVNEGEGGKQSSWGASKINGILNGHPNANFALIMFGTNDSKDENARPSGLGLQPGQAGYAGSYKANLQAMIDSAIARGKTPVLARLPIAYGNCGKCAFYPNPETAPQNVRIREYNHVVVELTEENDLPILGPDLYTYFAAHPEQMKDRLHPNGLGYRAMAELWRDALLAE